MLDASNVEQIGQYRIFAELGRGGMGRVLLGSGPDGRLVAVKVVHEKFVEDDRFRARFRREVRASRKVAGAYTAAVIDADPEAAEPWLASVYVPGPPLRQVVKDVPLTAEPALRLAASLAAALIEVHRAGLVHRDLKPSNVLLTDDGLRVIDFGVARAVENEDGSVATRTGALVGTPGFMSPEQARGQTLSPASDIFSLGSVLVYACTGQEPFRGPSTPRTLHNVIHADPDLAALPERLREVVRSCLAKDPDARPEPAQILEALGEVTPAARPWPAAVHELIARQEAEVAGLLGAPERPRAEGTEPDGGRPGIPTTADPTAADPGTPSVPDGPDGTGRTAPSRRRVLLMAGGGAVLGLAAVSGTAAWALRDDDTPASRGGRTSGGKSAARPLAALKGHTGMIHHLEFGSMDGLLVSAGKDGTVRLWDVAAQRLSGEPLKVADKPVRKATFAPSGDNLLATAGNDGPASPDNGVKLWDVDTRRQVGETLAIPMFDFTDQPGLVNDVAFSPDGNTLVGVGTTKLRMWDTESREPTGQIDLDDPIVTTDLSFSGDGRLLVVPHRKLIRLFDTASGKQVGRSMLGHAGKISTAVMSPDGRTLATGSWDTTLRLWDVQRGEPIGAPLRGHSQAIHGLAFTWNGRILVSASEDTSVRLWNADTRKPIGELATRGENLTAMALSQDGKTLATAAEGVIHLWDISDRIPA